MALVIVESAAKCKTIERYLNKIPELSELGPFKVKACFGHVLVLPEKEIGIDKTTWSVKYEHDKKKVTTIKMLRDEAKRAKMVYLASDMDLEGNAIASHLKSLLGLQRVGKDYHRVVFNEITKHAIKHAFMHPGDIDAKSVDAQETRRILDRIVGYEVSPLLWRQFQQSSLSAGRVQSAALNMIARRCDSIAAHEPEPFYDVLGNFKHGTYLLKTKMIEPDVKFTTLDEAKMAISSIVKNYPDVKFVATFSTKDVKRNPPPPFTTSTMQQECYSKHGIPAKRTMQIAQKLYESGFITYMRTDSVALSKDAQFALTSYIQSTYTDKYVQNRQYATKNANAQEAHEAIRPTDPTNLHSELDGQELKVYNAIWRRAIASQMAASVYTELSYIIADNTTKFKGAQEYLKFDGFQILYTSEKPKETPPQLKDGVVSIKTLHIEGGFTQPPAYYDESSIVKAMETAGIGRPSTYVTIIDKLFYRQYVEKKKNEPSSHDITNVTYTFQKTSVLENVATKLITVGTAKKDALHITELGTKVLKYLQDTVPLILDTTFTSEMEAKLDAISHAQTSKINVLNGFYKDFGQAIVNAKGQDTPVEAAPAKKTLQDFPNLNCQLVHTRFGHALFHPPTKKYVNVESFLEWRKLDVSDISQADARFLMSLPIPIPQSKKQVCIGRYGLYVKDGTKNIKLSKKLWNNVYDGDLNCLSELD